MPLKGTTTDENDSSSSSCSSSFSAIVRGRARGRFHRIGGRNIENNRCLTLSEQLLKLF